MDSQYQPFSTMDSTLDEADRNISQRTGMKRILTYLLYSVPLLLLLILLLVSGVIFSQLKKEITDVKLQLKIINNKGLMSSGTSGPTEAKQVLVERIVPVRGTCKEGWTSFQGSCYLLSTTITVWQRAEDQCRSSGGHLLVLNNVEELEYISGIVDIKHSYWIGLVERQHEGHWSWVDGTNFNSTPTFWDEGQPDNWSFRENGEDCGQLHASLNRKRKLWNDADCSLGYRYICEAKGRPSFKKTPQTAAFFRSTAMNVKALLLLLAACVVSGGIIPNAIWQFGEMISCAQPGVDPLMYNEYGCYCGLGGSGTPVDDVDRCCQVHDNCYSHSMKIPQCESILDLPYVVHYNFNCSNKQVYCSATEDKCQATVCECDRVAALCFARHKYHPKYKNLDSKYC